LKQFVIETKLDIDNLEQVIKLFDVTLFKALKPPLISLKVDRFDGCETGHEVHLTLGPFANRWVSHITSHEKSDKYFQFVDEGYVLPKPLSYWHHTHRIELRDNVVWIIDAIKFSTKPFFLEWIMKKVLYWQFNLRPAIYQKYFREN
jgi:ligand-binding SRPBCC domain-containing protein